MSTQPIHTVISISAFVFTAACASGGAATSTAARPAAKPATSSTAVVLHDTPLELHLALPAQPAPETPLVLYASGDGGWFGAAIDMFRIVAAHGYPAAGFSARAFLRIERPRHAALDARQLAIDYGTILAKARLSLGLAPDAPAILMGWSRGAAFASIVGSEATLADHLQGIIAIGLSADENLRVNDEDDGDAGSARGQTRAGAALRPYDRLLQAQPLRCAVIQATGDGYLRASDARALFGPDTAERRFYTVEARNHRFSGGRGAFVDALTSALSWVAHRQPGVR